MKGIGSPPSSHPHSFGLKFLFWVQADVGGGELESHFLLPHLMVRTLELVSSQGQSHGGRGGGGGIPSGTRIWSNFPLPSQPPFLPPYSQHFHILRLIFIDPHGQTPKEPDDTTLINK